jgi:glycosyltransferase involved in cell wall biosynthesis
MMDDINTRVCLPTLDPRSTAGVRTVTTFTYKKLEATRYEPYIVFNAIPWDECTTMNNIIGGKFSVDYEKGDFEDMTGIRIGRRLPEARIFNYLFNLKYWNQALNDANKFFGMGGPCLPCLPLAINDIPYGCWIGTTMYDEEKSRQLPLSIRRIRNKLTSPIIKKYEQYILERANIIAVQSHYTKSRINELFNIGKRKITVIPYPIDTEKYSPREGISSTPEILFVGRVTASRKNIPLLLRAFSKVLEQVPEATLTLIGGELNNHLQSLISNLDIENKVYCEGRVDDIVPYLDRANVFALPSNQEGLGIAGLEAQSCGTPVVATRCGGPQDYVEDGENGFLVPTKEVDRFADRIIQILANSQLQSKLGQNARSNIVSNFSKDEIAGQLISTIDELPTV